MRGLRLRAILIAAGLIVLASAPAAFGADRIYWGNGNGTISYANLDGTGGGGLLNLTGATPSGVRGLAIDSSLGRVFWADQGNDTVGYANLDGSGGGTLNISGATAVRPHGAEFDPATGRVYWANDDNTIAYAKADGSGGGGHLNIAGSTPSDPYGMAIDPVSGRVFWANRVTNTISYANLDGSGGGGELDVTGAPISKPHGTTIDHATGRIYWTNLDSTIGYANIDGSGGGGQLSTDGANDRGGIGMAIDSEEGRIYWGNLGNGTISYAKLDGSGGGAELDISGSNSFQARFVVMLRAPVAAGALQISGGSVTGSELTCKQDWVADVIGSFLYREPHTVAYQWQRDGADIPGATGSSYRPNAAGSHSCRVTGTNPAGAVTQTSAAIDVATNPKCKGLRVKSKRQRRGLAAAVSEKKQARIRANINAVGKRMKALGCR